MEQAQKDINTIKRGFTGMADWLVVRDEIFLEDEAIEAADFSDLMESYGVESDGLAEFINETELKIGHRLYIAENLPIEQLEIIILSEKDQRIVKVARKRKAENTE